MGVLPNLIYAREALFAYVNSPKRDMRNLRAIRRIDRSNLDSIGVGVFESMSESVRSRYTPPETAVAGLLGFISGCPMGSESDFAGKGASQCRAVTERPTQLQRVNFWPSLIVWIDLPDSLCDPSWADDMRPDLCNPWQRQTPSAGPFITNSRARYAQRRLSCLVSDKP
jgi:hypothetical protein